MTVYEYHEINVNFSLFVLRFFQEILFFFENFEIWHAYDYGKESPIVRSESFYFIYLLLLF